MSNTNRDTEADFAVVGAGPAGATAALCLARRGFRTVLLDATNLESERFGLTLPPEVSPVLHQLDVWSSFQRIPRIESPGIVSRWNSPVAFERDFTSNPHGCGWHIDRNAFDRMLCQHAADAGAGMMLGCRLRACSRHSGGYHLSLSTSTAETQLSCAVLVDASGRNGLPGASGHDRHSDDLLLAIVLEIVTTDHNRDCRTYIEAASHGWWYSAPSPGGSVVAMFFTCRETWSSLGIVLREQLADCPLTSRRIGSGRIIRQTLINVPSALSRRIAERGLIAVGDSAAAYDPISGHGVLKALLYGIAAAEAATDAYAGEFSLSAAYSARVESEFRNYAAERRALYRSVQRWGPTVFWGHRF